MRPRAIVAATLALGAAGVSAQAEDPDYSDWYRTEILIFARDGDAALAAEAWDPLPTLAYPSDYLFLIDPALADERLERADAYDSRIDERGVQTLRVPAPVTALEPVQRPDSALVAAVSPEPVNRPDARLAPAANAAGAPGAPQGDQTLPGRSGSDDSALAGSATHSEEEVGSEETDEPPSLEALPYELLPGGDLEFTAAARQLAREGQTVLFHGAWWAPLEESAETPTLVLDRGGDPDRGGWPALQGSLHIYRSRYLHAELDLWLNTRGAYLPPAWSMPAPPLTAPSLNAMDRYARPVDLFAPPPTLLELIAAVQAPSAAIDSREALAREGPAANDPGATPATETTAQGNARAINGDPRDDPVLGAVLAALEAREAAARGDAADDPVVPPSPANRHGNAASTSAEHAPAVRNDDPGDSVSITIEDPYAPFRHAIVHRQSRRMRSSETHYLDHPVLGVIIRIVPAEEERLPIRDSDHAEWRARHGLPHPPTDGALDAADSEG